jgi:hypothetical protein
MTLRFATPGVALLVALAVGCGGDKDSSDLDRAIAKLESASQGPQEDSKVGVANGVASAPALIRKYFELIDANDYSSAWAYLDTDVQEQFGGYESWRDGYATNTSTEVTDTNVTSTNGGETDLTVEIQAIESCGGERFEQSFEGPWSVDETRGKITDAEFALISGTSPPEDCEA